MMKLRFFALIMLVALSVHASQSRVKQLLSPQETLAVLEPLKTHAIVLGSGTKEVHSFIDPYCELSQEYLKFLYARDGAMLKKYKIYLYLYELPGKDSAEMIEALLESELKETMLRAVMLQHEEVSIDSDGSSLDAIETIAKTAQMIGVYKRPYIIINGKVK